MPGGSYSVTSRYDNSTFSGTPSVSYSIWADEPYYTIIRNRIKKFWL